MTWQVYFVVSPPCYRPRSYYYEPPDDSPCATEVIAQSRREAINLAIKTPEFKDWVDYMRGESRPPQSELIAYTAQEIVDS